MDSEGEDPPTPMEINRQRRRAAWRRQSMAFHQRNHMQLPKGRRAELAAARAARSRRMPGSGGRGVPASGVGGAPTTRVDGPSATGVGGALATEVWIPPSRREAEAWMTRVMAELKNMPDEPIPDNSELFFPLCEPVPGRNHLLPSVDEPRNQVILLA